MNEIVVKEWPEKFSSNDQLMIGVGKVVIDTALMFNTSLVFKEDGKIKEVSPAAMKRRLKKRKG